MAVGEKLLQALSLALVSVLQLKMCVQFKFKPDYMAKSLAAASQLNVV